MNDYEAKTHYRDKVIAENYNSQYMSQLRPTNFRVKFIGRFESMAFGRLLRLAPQCGRVLDIACGTGRYTEALLQEGFQVCGVDISTEMLEFAKERLGDNPDLLFLKCADAESLPFDDDSFDGVTCIRLLHRIPPAQRTQILREIKRVGNGWAIIFFGMSTPWLRLRHIVRSMIFRGRESNPYPMTKDELEIEFGSLGITMKNYQWVFPYLSSGMMAYVTWQT